MNIAQFVHYIVEAALLTLLPVLVIGFVALLRD